MTIDQKVAAFFSGVALIANLGLAKVVKAEEFNPNGWPVPDIKSATFVKGPIQKDLITEIPGKETALTVYKTPEGTYFNTLVYNGKLYGFYIDTDGKPPMEYGLMDQKGDGIFRHKYSTYESSPTPSYLLTEEISKK